MYAENPSDNYQYQFNNFQKYQYIFPVLTTYSELNRCHGNLEDRRYMWFWNRWVGLFVEWLLLSWRLLLRLWPRRRCGRIFSFWPTPGSFVCGPRTRLHQSI